MSTLKEVFGITNNMDYQTQKRLIIHGLGYEAVKKCIPFTLEELKDMQQKDPLLNDNQKEWERAAGFVNLGKTIVGSKLTALCVQNEITVFSCSLLVGVLKECAKMWIKEESTKKLIEKANELEEIQNTMTGIFKDADTVLVDILNNQDYEFSGFAQDIFNIWKSSSDKGAVEQIFFEFTGKEFTEYLQKAIVISHISIIANEMVDIVSEWLKEKSTLCYEKFILSADIQFLIHSIEEVLSNWSPEQIEDDKPQFYGRLIDSVEDFLEKCGIKANDIPCKDRNLSIEDGEDLDGLAIIYSEDYDYLANQFAEILNINR
ncbi:MAG: hypothetical protein E6686_03455 [Lachnospiraceae bacterium]|nr:hypothetical protein [Lachnospiraceae bacterium]